MSRKEMTPASRSVAHTRGRPRIFSLRNVVQGEAMESLGESLITSLDICSPTVEDSRFSILHAILFLD